MVETWTGSKGNDIKSATQSGFWPIKWWESWEMYGLGGDDTLTGGPESDRIWGDDGNDNLSGLDGHDFIDGGNGADTMFGGKGHDVFVVDASSDQVIERDGEGFDSVKSYAYSYTLPSFVEKLTLMDDEYGAGRIGKGNNLNNEIWGNKWGNILYGMGGNDTIYGQGGKDEIRGGSGDDTLYSAGGGAQVFGEDGKDYLSGRSGDQLYGGLDSDTYSIYSETGNDLPSIIEKASEGVDTVIFVNGSQTVVNRMPESWLSVENVKLLASAAHAVGNSQSNILHANTHIGSTLEGMGGRDILIGQEFKDALVGGEGGDTMRGNGGDDWISGYGGATGGRDWMTGGTGADTFSIGNFYQDSGHVVITDFSRQSGDKVQIKGSMTDYVLGSIDWVGSSDKLDGALYYRPTNDLVAVFSDNTGLALNTDFQFVY